MDQWRGNWDVSSGTWVFRECAVKGNVRGAWRDSSTANVLAEQTQRLGLGSLDPKQMSGDVNSSLQETETSDPLSKLLGCPGPYS